MGTLSRFLTILAIAAVAAIGAGCSKDDLPATPPPPFLFSDVRLQKDIVPLPGTFLQHGKNTTVRFNVAYTLAPEIAKNRSNLRLFLNLYGEDSVGTILAIGAFPDRVYTLDQDGSNVSDSINFTVPANAAFVDVEAFLDTLPFANPIITIDSKYWPVR